MDNELSNAEITLFLNGNKESELAQEYLSDNGINFYIRFCSTDSLSEFSYADPLFSNSFKEPMIPSLIMRHPSYMGNFSYLSFSGVKSLIRDKLRNELNGESQFFSKYVNFYWRDIKTFYPHQDYDKEKGFSKKRELITCFDRDQKKIFEGPIKESPYQLKELLETHDFKDWHYVSSWEIGELEELTNKKNRKGVVIDRETRTVLFPDEVETLGEGRRIVTKDSRSIYHVTFEAYFNDNGNIFGLYAFMFD